MEQDDDVDMFFMSPEGVRYMMYKLGSQFIRGGPPLEESIRQVEAVFSMNDLQNNLRNTISFCYCKGGDECKSFIQGNDVCFSPNMSLFKLILNKQLRRLIETTLRKGFDDIKEQGPAIVEFRDNQTPAPYFTAHPSRDAAISVFRPLGKRLCWQNGLFKLFTCSHDKSKEQFESEDKDAHEIIVEPNEILVVIGGLFVQPSPNGGGRMVWQGFSNSNMLGNIDSPLALPFMTT